MARPSDGRPGWDSFFEDQLAASEAELSRLRIDAVHRGRLTGLVDFEQFDIDLPFPGLFDAVVEMWKREAASVDEIIR